MSRSSWFVAALGVVAASSASADPKFEFGKAEEVEKVKGTEWTATAEAGLVFTTGNSETTTATGGLKASRKQGNNKLSLEASATYAQSSVLILADQNGNGLVDNETEIISESTVTANTLASKLRYDRFLTKYNSLFVAALAGRDVPAGKDAVLGGQAGYSRQLHKSETSEATGEFGYDFSYEQLTVGATNEIHSARAQVAFKGTMTEGTTVEASAEILSNLNSYDLPTEKDAGFLEDTRVNLRTAVNAKIGKRLAFSTSLEAKYDHRPAPLAVKNLAMGFVPEAARLDTIMKASLIYNFF